MKRCWPRRRGKLTGLSSRPTVTDRIRQTPKDRPIGPNATSLPVGLFIPRGCFCLPAEPKLIYYVDGNMDDVGRPSFYHLSSTSDGNLGRLFSLKAAWQSSMGPRRNGAAMGVTVPVLPDGTWRVCCGEIILC